MKPTDRSSSHTCTLDDEVVRNSRRQVLLYGAALTGAGLGLPLTGCATAPTSAAAPLASAYPVGTMAKPLPLRATSLLIPTRVTGEDAYPVYFRRTMPTDMPLARYPGFQPGTALLKKGTIRREGVRPLPCDILFDRDVAVKMRDGITIYVDVFRPADGKPVPTIMAFSPYGKQVGGQHFDDVPNREQAIPRNSLSELQRFEGPDPAHYVDRGYALINPDPRGAFNSEGNISWWGRQTGEDGYDIIEWVARQSWSDGKVAMSGNSWLAASQWHIAAQRPPHLAAIAPWEGVSDYFRASALRGGIPLWTMSESLLATFGGNGLSEDMPRMVNQTTGITPYWTDKAAQLEKIDVPAYIVASYTHPAHTHGTFEGFRRISSQRKWLRVHNTREWQDYNSPEKVADLTKFFDHVLKGVDNGWDRTPKVRVSVLDQGGTDVVERPEREWPLARQQFTPLYLAPAGALSPTPVATAASVRQSAENGVARFVLKMERDTEITGYLKARLWVQAEGNDDMDLNVSLAKLGADGKPVMDFRGPVASGGILRVSRRELDAAKSTPSEPYLSFGEPQPLKDGEIVPVEINLWPVGIMVRAGQSVVVTVRAHTRFSGASPWAFGTAKIPVPKPDQPFTYAPGSTPPDMVVLGAPADTLPALAKEQEQAQPPLRNRGMHIIHFGGRFDSHVLVPIIPVA